MKVCKDINKLILDGIDKSVFRFKAETLLNDGFEKLFNGSCVSRIDIVKPQYLFGVIPYNNLIVTCEKSGNNWYIYPDNIDKTCLSKADKTLSLILDNYEHVCNLNKRKQKCKKHKDKINMTINRIKDSQ